MAVCRRLEPVFDRKNVGLQLDPSIRVDHPPHIALLIVEAVRLGLDWSGLEMIERAVVGSPARELGCW